MTEPELKKRIVEIVIGCIGRESITDRMEPQELEEWVAVQIDSDISELYEAIRSKT